MNKVEFRAEGLPLPVWILGAEKFIHKVLETLGPRNWEFSVLFCDNRYIKSLNSRFRSMDEATDVLSFPLGERSRGGRYLAGDIAISLEALEENVKFFKVSADEELRRLLVHGILHLYGAEHATNKEGEPMLKIQEQILTTVTEKIL